MEKAERSILWKGHDGEGGCADSNCLVPRGIMDVLKPMVLMPCSCMLW